MYCKVNNSCSSSAAALPQALTARILQLVPQQQRLTHCALACKAWAAAAAAATVHVQYTPDCRTITNFQDWLEQHAGQLLTLQVTSDSGSEIADSGSETCEAEHDIVLPREGFPNLQQLHLKGIKLRELLAKENSASESGSGDDSGSDSSWENLSLADFRRASSRKEALASSSKEAVIDAAPLPKLQHLHLEAVELFSIGSLLELVQSPELITVRLHSISIDQPRFDSEGGFGSGLPCDVEFVGVAGTNYLLQQLTTRLEVLEIPGFPIPTQPWNGMEYLSALQGLQELSITHLKETRMMNLSLLPSSITRLELHGCNHTSLIPPKLQQLAGLLDLKLASCVIPPAVLSSFPYLQKLCLKHCTLLGTVNARVRADLQYDVDGTAALLGELRRLTTLQHLELNLKRLDTCNTPPTFFSALTASSRLTELTLAPKDRTPLPKGAARQMFSKGRLPLLQRLTISTSCDHRVTASAGDWRSNQWCLHDADIKRIAGACPALQWLDIALAVEPVANLFGLLRLPQSCTSLLVGGVAFADHAAAVVKQLTQVQYLCWHRSRRFTDAGLEQLVEMRLDRLYVYDCGLTDAISDEGELGLDGDEHKGSVSQQLNALCDFSPICAPARLRNYKAAAAARELALQQENADLRAQLSRSKEQAQQLQRQFYEACGGHQ